MRARAKQVGCLSEKVSACLHGKFGYIYLSVSQSPKQIIRGKVDKLYLVSPVEQEVRYCFTNIDACYLGYHVIQTFEMLHIHCRIDCDSDSQSSYISCHRFLWRDPSTFE